VILAPQAGASPTLRPDRSPAPESAYFFIGELLTKFFWGHMGALLSEGAIMVV